MAPAAMPTLRPIRRMPRTPRVCCSGSGEGQPLGALARTAVGGQQPEPPAGVLGARDSARRGRGDLDRIP